MAAPTSEQNRDAQQEDTLVQQQEEASALVGSVRFR